MRATGVGTACEKTGPSSLSIPVPPPPFHNLATWSLIENADIVTNNLAESKISDQQLRHIAKVKSLTRLYLFDTKISNVGAACVSDLPLQELVLVKTRVDDRIVPVLSKMKTLKELNLNETRITEPAVNRLHAALPDCRIGWADREKYPLVMNDECLVKSENRVQL